MTNNGDPTGVISVRAELDVPGETRRQAFIGVLWAMCLFVAVCAGVVYRPRVSSVEAVSAHVEQELARSRSARLKVALVFGVLLPAMLTLATNRRYRRGGGHARGIVVDVTEDDELRLWGRGYGARVYLPGAQISERLVDVYAGRLGAWRQRRLRVRSTGARAGQRELELSTVAVPSDVDDGLRVEGGEGDCVELDREGFESIRACVLERARQRS